jgi:hypothetical protein
MLYSAYFFVFSAFSAPLREIRISFLYIVLYLDEITYSYQH